MCWTDPEPIASEEVSSVGRQLFQHTPSASSVRSLQNQSRLCGLAAEPRSVRPLSTCSRHCPRRRSRKGYQFRCLRVSKPHSEVPRTALHTHCVRCRSAQRRLEQPRGGDVREELVHLPAVLGDDRSVKMKSLGAAKIMKMKLLVLGARAVRIPDKSSCSSSAVSESESEVVRFSKRKKTWVCARNKKFA